jgi:hypothetical protein
MCVRAHNTARVCFRACVRACVPVRRGEAVVSFRFSFFPALSVVGSVVSACAAVEGGVFG